MLNNHKTMMVEPRRGPPAESSSPADSVLRQSHRQSVVDFFNNRFSWWERVYGDNLPRGFFSYEMNRRKEMVIAAVTSYLMGQQHRKILECGCGPGGILRDLPLQGHEVFGTDINGSYLVEMHKACSQVTGICCDIEDMPFADNLFDVVICVGVLPYLQNDEQAIAEMARLLKPGGLLVISNPSYYMIDKFFDPYYYLAWPVRQVNRLARKARKTNLSYRSTAEDFSSARIRRYCFEQLDPFYRCYGLHKCQDRPVSYGPFRIWKKECLRVQRSIRISELLVRMAGKKPLRSLQRLANHRVTCLIKQQETV